VNYICTKVSDEPETSIFRTEDLHARTQSNVPQDLTLCKRLAPARPVQLMFNSVPKHSVTYVYSCTNNWKWNGKFMFCKNIFMQI